MRLHPLAGTVLVQAALLVAPAAAGTPGAALVDFSLPGVHRAAFGSNALNACCNWVLAAIEASPAPRSQRLRPGSGDRWQGRPIEVGLRPDSGYEYRQTFGEADALDDPDIEGFEGVRWDRARSALNLEGGAGGRRVSLRYHFSSPFQMKEMLGELEGEIRGPDGDWVELSLAPDGLAFGHAVRAYARPDGNPFCLSTVGNHKFDSEDFWVRISAQLGPDSRVALTSFRTACRIKPPARPEVALHSPRDGRIFYRETFQSPRLIRLAEIENRPALEWTRGGIFIRGSAAGPVRVVLRQRFLVPEPVRTIAVRVQNMADRRECGGTNVFGLSLDGSTLVAREATPDSEGVFQGTTELRLDDPDRLANARQFFLHVELANGAAAPTDPSNSISCIEVEAQTARP